MQPPLCALSHPSGAVAQYAIRNERYRYIANIPYNMETYKPESWTKPLSQQLYVRQRLTSSLQRAAQFMCRQVLRHTV